MAGTGITLFTSDSTPGSSGNTFTTTATAAGTTTLTTNSNNVQEFTGSSTQTVKLPTTSIASGRTFIIINKSSGKVTVQSSNASTLQILNSNTQVQCIANITTPTTPTNWDYTFQPIGAVTVLQSDLTFIGFGTMGQVNIAKNTNGSMFSYIGNATTGTNTGVTAKITLTTPINATIYGTVQTQVGTWQCLENTTLESGTLFYDGSDTSNIYFATAVDGSKNYVKLNSASISNPAEVLMVIFQYPI